MITVNKTRLVFILVLLLCLTNSYAQLTHPGGWLMADDLALIRTKVAAQEEPWYGAWLELENDNIDETYTATVTPTITNSTAIQKQGHAAYILALKWVASGDQAYAAAGINIINAWASTVTSFETDNSPLREGIGSNKMANAAEILAQGFNGDAGWSATKIKEAQDWFQNVIYPITSTGPSRSMNWGTSCLAGNMSMAIFCDNMTMFNEAVDAYKFGFTNTNDGCAGVTQYIINEDGQCFESERDQGHTQGGIAHLVEPAFIAWNQGVDLVSYSNDRLVAGMEYTAKYNLFNDVSWTNNVPNPCNQSFGWMNNGFISADDRGDFSPIYVMASTLFTRAGKSHPYTNEVITHENYAQPEFYNDDHPGAGTLCFTVDENPGDPISGFDTNGLPVYNMNVLPMTIEAENFDYLVSNGQGKTYSDLTSSNEGGQYRTDEHVDIESLTGGNYNITSIKNGEWLLYTVNVSANGIYDIDINYAAANSNGTIKFNLDGTDVTSNVSVPFGSSNSTGLTDWKNFKVISSVRLSKGIHVLKVLFNGEDDAFKLNNFTVSLVEADPEETVLIQAEDYSAMNGVRTETTSDVGGGLNVGYIDAGDWMEYHVDIVNSGTFILNYRVASRSGGGSVEFLVDGVAKGTTGIASTGDWQAFTTLSASVSLASGSHTIRLNVLSGGWNINWFQLVFDEADSLSQEAFDKNNGIRLYPNPVSNNLTVRIPISEFSAYTIFDMSGRVNKQGVITSGTQKLNIEISDFSKGIYLITLKGNQLTKTFKLVKE
ncbi:carbohydrate-binding protein [Mariniflexile sp. AS56]|uniref:carbohydrate-binding protein n=1 Tax=Mariniflexile sp. AS56 TaxID=3063957 RepID=UPI0026EA8E8D|nr:carbohydrate-binding protein [Mariniflexile sp. AS56]MDO7171624.1 carbohydrate-binding protein [Mariniflexile sp. AS56]